MRGNPLKRMTLAEANELLDNADTSEMPSRVNPALTRGQAVEIIRKGINSGPQVLQADGINLDPLFEKRVLQVSRNQRRPRLDIQS